MKFAGVSKFNTESPNQFQDDEKRAATRFLTTPLPGLEPQHATPPPSKPAQRPGLIKLDSSQISERLIESVNMVKDLVCKNSKLRDTIDKFTKKEIQYENELLDYQFENQELRDRIEILENIIMDSGNVRQGGRLPMQAQQLSQKIMPFNAGEGADLLDERMKGILELIADQNAGDPGQRMLLMVGELIEQRKINRLFQKRIQAMEGQNHELIKYIDFVGNNEPNRPFFPPSSSEEEAPPQPYFHSSYNATSYSALSPVDYTELKQGAQFYPHEGTLRSKIEYPGPTSPPSSMPFSTSPYARVDPDRMGTTYNVYSQTLHPGSNIQELVIPYSQRSSSREHIMPHPPPPPPGGQTARPQRTNSRGAVRPIAARTMSASTVKKRMMQHRPPPPPPQKQMTRQESVNAEQRFSPLKPSQPFYVEPYGSFGGVQAVKEEGRQASKNKLAKEMLTNFMLNRLKRGGASPLNHY